MFLELFIFVIPLSKTDIRKNLVNESTAFQFVIFDKSKSQKKELLIKFHL